MHELTFEPRIDQRTSYAAEKELIARAAARHAMKATSLLLDAGSTTATLAGRLVVHEPTVIYTNSLPIATVLAARADMTVRLLGGTIRLRSMAGVGRTALDALATVNVDLAFLGTNGISFDRGLTTPDEDEALVKNRMLATARRRILLADHSKFGLESLCRHAGLADIDLVITDSGVADADVRALSDLGIDVEIAERS